jgi:hypothetical protein
MTQFSLYKLFCLSRLSDFQKERHDVKGGPTDHWERFIEYKQNGKQVCRLADCTVNLSFILQLKQYQ